MKRSTNWSVLISLFPPMRRLVAVLVLAAPLVAAGQSVDDMALIIGENGQFCIDRYEASLDLNGMAVSVPGVLPQVNISGVQAMAACEAAGKHLCTDAEWIRACQGPTGFIYPYGNTLQPGVCNDTRELKETGDSLGCVSIEGVYDMVGNVGEWTNDPAGTFRGGYFGDISLNGYGCLYRTTARDFAYSDNTTGFRCCAGTERCTNQPPVANAGTDQTLKHAVLITLDGSGSSDPDGNYPLTYAWEIAAKPSGSNSILNNPNTVNPSFSPDFFGNYEIQLIVTDALGLSSAPDTVIVSTNNTAPVADAGPDQSLIIVGSTVYLDGTKSYDDDGDPFTYSWAISQKPAGSNANLSDATSPTPTFVADVQGDYIVFLAVTDTFGTSNTDWATISFTNVKPVADAGGNQSVKVESTVTLDGSGSSDANSDPLTYQWSIITKPAGSTAIFDIPTPDDPTPAQTSFTADKAGDYIISLVVNDGFVNSDPNNVTVTATSSSNQVNDILKQTITTINGLSPEVLKNPNMRNALTNKINAVLKLIDQGLYMDAIDKLGNDILQKTGGCANTGAPDKNDWIKDCATQGQVYPLIMEAIRLLGG